MDASGRILVLADTGPCNACDGCRVDLPWCPLCSAARAQPVFPSTPGGALVGWRRRRTWRRSAGSAPATCCTIHWTTHALGQRAPAEGPLCPREGQAGACLGVCLPPTPSPRMYMYVSR